MPIFNPRVPSKNITNVFKNNPRNIDIEMNDKIFLIGNTFFKKLVNPNPKRIASGTNSKNLIDGTSIPIKTDIANNPNTALKDINLSLFFSIKFFI